MLKEILQWKHKHKHNLIINTITLRKYFLVFNSNGIISFVLYLWTGRVSDKELTKCSHFLEKLEPEDDIIVDRGFDIADILPSGVTLIITALKGGRDWLNLEQTDDPFRIPAARIRVKRAIGQIKKYHILGGNWPLSMTPLMNQVYTVSSYSTNSLPLLVPPNEANTD